MVMSIESAGLFMPGSSPHLAPVRASLSRGALFGGCAILGIANGLLVPILHEVASAGWAQSLWSLFGISLIVWAGCLAAPALLLRCRAVPASRADAFAVAPLLLLSILPLGGASWVGLTLLALYLLIACPSDGTGASELRRGAWILLAVTGSMFWGRLLLHNSGDWLLAADARMVAFLTGMPRDGNLIATADGGYLWIAPYCSSLTNISLAVLCCTLVVQWQGLCWDRRHAACCICASLAVALINHTRIAIMVWRPDLYDTVHGPQGLTAASWATVLAIVLIIWQGNRVERRIAH